MKKVEKKRRLARLLSLVMATMLAAGSTNAVMADNSNTVHSSDTTDVQVALTKNYIVPTGVTLPAADFAFNYSKDGIVTGSTGYDCTVSEDSTQPDLIGIDGDADISYAAKLTKTGTTDGKDVYVKTVNVVPAGSAFGHAGEYVYTITEKSGTNTTLDKAMTYSKAEYKLHVFVKNSGSGLLVSGASVYQTKKNDGSTGTNAKVDLDNSTLLGGKLSDGKGNDFEFSNLYAPTDEVLSISKNVTGDYADKSKPFTMSVTLNKPTTYEGTSFAAVVTDSSDTPVNTTLLSFTDKTAANVTLASDQKLVFVESDTKLSTSASLTASDTNCMPAGLTYSITESKETDYSPTAVVTHGGTQDSELSGETGADFTVDTNTIVDIGNNNTAMKSAYHQITITGVIIRVLPAVIMVLIALAGFAITKRSGKRV